MNLTINSMSISVAGNSVTPRAFAQEYVKRSRDKQLDIDKVANQIANHLQVGIDARIANIPFAKRNLHFMDVMCRLTSSLRPPTGLGAMGQHVQPRQLRPPPSLSAHANQLQQEAMLLQQRRQHLRIARAQPVNLAELFPLSTGGRVTFADVTFNDARAAEDPQSFFRIDKDTRTLHISQNTLAALSALKRNAYETQYPKLCDELRRLEDAVHQGAADPMQGLTTLKLFTKYQIYKTGAHSKTRDEDDWARQIAQRVLKEDSTLAAKGVTEENLAEEIGKHYMCRCKYSRPRPAFVRKDMPREAQERLRVRARDVRSFVFRTANGFHVAYDPKVESLASVKAEYDHRLKQEYKNAENLTAEYVPFDSDHFMIADVQVPMMEEGRTIEVRPDGRPPVRILLGNSPHNMGVDMTNEDAGVMRRSPNSQRVTQINILADDGSDVALDFKGSGVPAYGFLESDTQKTGADFFALETESTAMAVNQFSRDVLGYTDVISDVQSLAQVAGDRYTSSVDSVRNGAAMVRVDPFFGIRLANSEEQELQGIAATMVGRNLDTSWRESVVDNMARNTAVCHLLGLEYENSGVARLDDLGLRGTFSDSGELHPLRRDAKLDNSSVITAISNFHPSGLNAFYQTYTQTFYDAITTVAETAGNPEEQRILQARDALFDRVYTAPEAIFWMMKVGEEMRDHDGYRKEYAKDGVVGFADGLGRALVNVLADAAETKANRIKTLLNQGNLYDVFYGYNIDSDAALMQAMQTNDLQDHSTALNRYKAYRARELAYPLSIESYDAAVASLATRCDKYNITNVDDLKKVMGIGVGGAFPTQGADGNDFADLVNELVARGVLEN